VAARCDYSLPSVVVEAQDSDIGNALSTSATSPNNFRSPDQLFLSYTKLVPIMAESDYTPKFAPFFGMVRNKAP
jgi:hypothetical protein